MTTQNDTNISIYGVGGDNHNMGKLGMWGGGCLPSHYPRHTEIFV